MSLTTIHLTPATQRWLRNSPVTPYVLVYLDYLTECRYADETSEHHLAGLAHLGLTANRYPDAIPLQAGLDQILPLPAQVNAGTVNVDLLKAEYNIAQRAMVLQVKVDNRSQDAVRIGEFSSSNVHFMNAEMFGVGYTPGKDDVSNNGLSLNDNSPIQSGEQRTVTLEVRDAAWESEKLDGLIRDADSRLGGLAAYNPASIAQRHRQPSKT